LSGKIAADSRTCLFVEWQNADLSGPKPVEKIVDYFSLFALKIPISSLVNRQAYLLRRASLYKSREITSGRAG
jgi:hypothetical protein